MEKCPICGRDVESKRKNAIYCRNPQCRKQAHLNRKKQAATLPPSLSVNKASVVVSFPDGSRWILELTPLQATSLAQMPMLTQVPCPPLENRIGSDPSSSISSAVLSSTAEITQDQIRRVAAEAMGIGPDPEIRTEPIPAAPDETTASTQIAPAGQPSTDDPPDRTAGQPSTDKVAQPAFRTVELFFEDERGRVLTFSSAVRRRSLGDWRLRAQAKARLGRAADDGYGLGGIPGSWPRFFGAQSPSEFGQDANIGVLFFDEETNEVCVARSPLLREALGRDWMELIRKVDS